MELAHFIDWITEYAPYAHYVLFFLLILAGFNIPISEDILLIAGGVLASTVIPENKWLIFFGLFFGAYFSDWISYGLGRKFGPKILSFKAFSSDRTHKLVDRIAIFYKKYGFWTLLLGRFIPFGVRNCLFLTAGLSKMPFLQFIVADGIACFTSNSVLFHLSYAFGENYHALWSKVQQGNQVIFTLFCIFLIAVGISIVYSRRGESKPSP